MHIVVGIAATCKATLTRHLTLHTAIAVQIACYEQSIYPDAIETNCYSATSADPACVMSIQSYGIDKYRNSLSKTFLDTRRIVYNFPEIK